MSERVTEIQGPFGEGALFSERLRALECELAAGSYDHAPLYFLAGLEMEFLIAEVHLADGAVVDFNQSLGPKGIELGSNGILASQPIRGASWVERQAKLNEIQEEARGVIEALKPEDEAELRRKRQWLEEAASLTLPDAINFKLYQEFSVPTLGLTVIPEHASYDEVMQYAEQQGWLEFRFGPGTLQSGYYDNPGIAEIRFNPCPPSELARREKIVTKYLAEMATEYGTFGLFAGRHPNVSAYQEDKQGKRQPILGNASGREAAMLHAGAGLVQAIEEGVWLHTGSKERLINFHDIAGGRFAIGPGRNAIRIKGDYLELRSPDLMANTEHGLLFMMAGMAQGLQHGWGHAARNGHQVPLPRERLVAAPSEAYDKQQHLQILRALQKSEIQADGSLQLNVSHNIDRYSQIAQAIGLGEDCSAIQCLAFNYIAISALRIDDEGVIHCTAENVRKAYTDLQVRGGLDLNEIAPLMESPNIEELAALIDSRVKAVRFKQGCFIEARPYYKGLSPSETQTRLMNSPVFHRMYGGYAGEYSARLHRIIQPVYESATFDEVLQAALRQAVNADTLTVVNRRAKL